MIFMTTDETVVYEALQSLRYGTELPPFRIAGPVGRPASGRVIRITDLGDRCEVETIEERIAKVSNPRDGSV